MDHLEPNALAKTTHMNALLDFYSELLTEKQKTMLSYYYYDDFSLGEIATEFGISRQAVYDNIKRSQQALESYERKLGLLARHERVLVITAELEAALQLEKMNERQKEAVSLLIEQLRSTEMTAQLEAKKHGSI